MNRPIGAALSMGDTLARNAMWFGDVPAYVCDGRVPSL